MENKTKEISEDEAIEYPIHATNMEAKVRFYPRYMGSQDYTFLAEEIKKFHETFWSMGDGEVTWTDCAVSNQDIEDTQIKFFLEMKFIKPIGEIEKKIDELYPASC